MTQLELRLTSPEKDLQQILFEAMEVDDDWRTKYGDSCINLYDEATGKEKEMIDVIFMNLCGWSFATLTHAYRHNLDPPDASVSLDEQRKPPPPK